MTALAMRSSGRHQCREPAPWRRDARHVRAALAGSRRRPIARSAPSPTASTCRRGSPASGPALRAPRQPRLARPVRDPRLWARVLEIPDDDVWAARHALRDLSLPVHPRTRARTVDRRPAERRTRRRRRRDARSLGADDWLRASVHAATSGRSLIFHDVDRLTRLLNDAQRPIQLVFAGKAHPADEPASTSCKRSSGAHSTPSSAGASRSSTTTICTSRTSWSRAATSGSTRRASRSRRAARAA